jgi:hypothetical protein
MRLYRHKIEAAAGDNYPRVDVPANCVLKRVELLTTNTALNASMTVKAIYVKNNFDSEQSLHLDGNLILLDRSIWAWDGDIHFDVPFSVVGSCSDSAAADIIELVVCFELDGERP